MIKNIPVLKNFKSYQKKQFTKKFDKAYLEIKKEVKELNKTLNILDSKFKYNFNLKDLNKFKNFNKIAIIGMGGSILGAEALYGFLEEKIKKKIYFFDDINENKIFNFKKKENLSKVLFIIISKSGNTVETLSNSFSLRILKKNSKNIIIISEKKNNLLFTLSKKLNLFYIQHRNYVGGRYSVLSEVGMIPAYLMGLNLNNIRSKILHCLQVKNKTILKNTTIKLVQIINSKKFNNLIFLNYEPKLDKFLFWCQQLIAESLGKKNKGLLPIISKAPKDHHSLLQLYLDGPKDKLFYIFSSNVKSNKKKDLGKDLKIKTFLKGKNLSIIKTAQKNALINCLIEKKIPYRKFEIKKIDEEFIGKLFSYFMIETTIVGKMMNINPFDQPAVEKVKIYTKKILS